MRRTPRALRAPLVLLLVLLVAACSGGAEDPTVATEPPAAATDESAAPATEGEAAAGDTLGVQVTGEPDAKPEITLPEGEAPPTELVVVDLIEGDGAEVPADATVTTHYVGVSWLNEGRQFDSSWDRGEPISFPLSGVIPGWTEGIPGMKVGGRRMLIIPPDMAYGDDSPSPDIAPGDTLVFVIDLVDVQ